MPKIDGYIERDGERVSGLATGGIIVYEIKNGRPTNSVGRVDEDGNAYKTSNGKRIELGVVVNLEQD